MFKVHGNVVRDPTVDEWLRDFDMLATPVRGATVDEYINK